MTNKPKTDTEVIVDFGDDFGQLTKSDISKLFIDIHASISPLDPLNKMQVNEMAQ